MHNVSRARSSALAALLLPAMLVAGCGTDSGPSAIATAPPAPVISDGAHQGNEHFYFLPPLVPAPAYSGTADGSLAPSVSVCEWNASDERCGPIVASFSIDAGTGSEVVRYDATAEQYIVNWKTDRCVTGACSLDPSKQYRLRIAVGGAELGFADVTVVASASALKNVKTGETIALLDGRTLPVKFRIERGAVLVLDGGSASVGAAGGALTTVDGSAALAIPPAALSQTTPITMETTTGATDFAPTVELGPDGTQFAAPVTLTLPYEPSRLPAGVLPSDLAIFTHDGGGWVEVPGGVVDEANAAVSVPIHHFSSYTINIRPNTVNGTPAPTTIGIGDSTFAAASSWYYVTVPGRQYCSPVYGYRYSWGRWIRVVIGWSCYTTGSTTYWYPARQMAVYWSTSAAAVASVAVGPTYTDLNGNTQSPAIRGMSPGAAAIRGTVSGVTSAPLTISVFGTLGLLPKTADNVAGWSVRQQITQPVALPNAVTVSLANRNSYLVIGEPGTSNYTYGGQTGTYVIAAGATSKELVAAGLNGPGVDTLIASAPFFRPDTAVITLVQGKFLVAGWPTSLQVGDSAAITVTVASQAGALGNLAYPIDVALSPSGGLTFTNGTAPITTIRVQQRTSATFYVKATQLGTGSARFSHRDYVNHDATVTVQPPALVGPQSVCGHAITGIGFDGTYYYVGEGHDGLLQCLSRFSASTGALVDYKQIYLDHRGVHWVQSLGALTSRTWGGPIFRVDYSTLAMTQLASNPTASRPGDEQSQPAVDRDGQSYWILNAGRAERRRLSDHGLLTSFAVTTTVTFNTIAASDDWVFVLDGAGVNAYSKTSGAFAGRQPLPHAHPCNYFGFGVSASADRIMYLSDCRHVEIVPVTVTFREPTYVPADLGLVAGYAWSEARAINSVGRIVGQAGNGFPSWVGFYRDATMTAPARLPNPYGDWYEANDVNEAGTIASRAAYAGFLVQPGATPNDAATVTLVPAPPANNRNGSFGINNTGMVLACRDNGQAFQDYLWNRTTGDLTLIPNAYRMCVGKINDAGFAITNSDPGAGGSAWLWDPNTRNVTRAPSLGGMTIGRDINSAGVVVGQSQVGGRWHAFRWLPGQTTVEDLGTLGGLESAAMGINRDGYIVGWSLTASGERRAFLWDPGTRQMTDLGVLSGFSESTANDINDHGVIVGASGSPGAQRATKWERVP